MHTRNKANLPLFGFRTATRGLVCSLAATSFKFVHHLLFVLVHHHPQLRESEFRDAEGKGPKWAAHQRLGETIACPPPHVQTVAVYGGHARG